MWKYREKAENIRNQYVEIFVESGGKTSNACEK